jgi:hypothetical protein
MAELSKIEGMFADTSSIKALVELRAYCNDCLEEHDMRHVEKCMKEYCNDPTVKERLDRMNEAYRRRLDEQKSTAPKTSKLH